MKNRVLVMLPMDVTRIWSENNVHLHLLIKLVEGTHIINYCDSFDLRHIERERSIFLISGLQHWAKDVFLPKKVLITFIA